MKEDKQIKEIKKEFEKEFSFQDGILCMVWRTPGGERWVEAKEIDLFSWFSKVLKEQRLQARKEVIEEIKKKLFKLQDEFDNRDSLDLWNAIDELLDTLK